MVKKIFIDKCNNYRIACIVVTYNRRELLRRCLDAICKQTLKPDVVYITDNASTDGTIEMVKEWGGYNCRKNNILFKYVLNSKNEGGAGGFCLGMKTAFDDSLYDAFWVMDDDGEPEENCLQAMAVHLGKRDYLAPLVLSDVDHRSCSFTANHEDVDTFLQTHTVENNLIENYDSPFNGILYSEKLVKQVGFPKKEMFIWGDEINYRLRCASHGFFPATVIEAVHYHPLCRSQLIEYKGNVIKDIRIDWKLYCYLRNMWYNGFYVGGLHIGNILRALKTIVIVRSYYLEKYKQNKTKLIVDAYFSALTCNFNRLHKYMY